MSNGSAVLRACGLFAKASEEDRNKNYEEALQFYNGGVELLISAIRHGALDESEKEYLRFTSEKYLRRAEEIRELLDA